MPRPEDQGNYEKVATPGNYTSFGQVARAAANYRPGNDTTLNAVPKVEKLSQLQSEQIFQVAWGDETFSRGSTLGKDMVNYKLRLPVGLLCSKTRR